MVRIVVSVDPSGASDDEQNADNDEVGITVDGLGVDGNAYLLEDLTVKGGPSVWGKVAVLAYMRHEADVIVGETNFGGGMVKFVVQAAAVKLGTRVTSRWSTPAGARCSAPSPSASCTSTGRCATPVCSRSSKTSCAPSPPRATPARAHQTAPTRTSGLWPSCSQLWSSLPRNRQTPTHKTTTKEKADGWDEARPHRHGPCKPGAQLLGHRPGRGSRPRAGSHQPAHGSLVTQSGPR
ncbi:conserved hypothetical protein [Ricinus communis]|uniref:Uncharacterized protein n=1 Tax=Ricinus communis TaxID=3988 RepID=B9TJ23_RICCO|nr:conserved hypothetical protein [Ricinus communis]